MPLVVLLLAAAPGSAEVTGGVVDEAGEFLEHARVAGSSGEVAYTDSQGEFRLAATEPPCNIDVSHPRFAAQQRRIDDAGYTLVVLEPKGSAPEKDPAVVPVRRPRAPATVEPAAVSLTDLSAEPRTIESALSGVSGAAPDGAGGLHEGLAVRGLAGRRLLTVIAGVPIVSLRDEGAAASFVDPALLERVDLLRGPAGAGYGALGGVVEVHPLQLEDKRAEAGVETQGAERWVMGGWGLRGYATVALAARGSADSESAGGDEPLDDGHLRSSALLRGHGPLGPFDVDITFLPTWSRDAGLPQGSDAGVVTEEPVEEHFLAHVAVSKDAWSARFYAHPNELVTEERGGGESTRVESDALDFGASFELRRTLGGRAGATFGLDLSGRRGVDRREEHRGAAFRELVDVLDGASEDGAALFGTVRLAAGPLFLQGGGRVAWQRQDDAGAETESDGAPSGFLGVLWPAGGGLEVALNVGTGLRFPALDERFGARRTEAGELRGNPELDPERAATVDAGIRWFGERVRADGALFHTEVRDFIQQVPQGGGGDTLENVTHGRIVGGELDVAVDLSSTWRLAGSGHWQRGRDDDGRPLADVAASRVGIALAMRRGRLDASLDVTQRFRKDDPGPGEQELDAYLDVAGATHFELRRGMHLGLEASNLLDRDARTEADEEAPEVRGRSLGLTFRWRFN